MNGYTDTSDSSNTIHKNCDALTFEVSDHMKTFYNIRSGSLPMVAASEMLDSAEAEAAILSIVNMSNNNDNSGMETVVAPVASGLHDDNLDHLQEDEMSFRAAVYTHIRQSSLLMGQIIDRLSVIERNQEDSMASVKTTLSRRAITAAAAATRARSTSTAVDGDCSSTNHSELASQPLAMDKNIGNHNRITVLWKTNYYDAIDSTNLFAITSSIRRTQKVPKIAHTSKFVVAFPATRVSSDYIVSSVRHQAAPMKVRSSTSIANSVAGATNNLSILTTYEKTSSFTMSHDSLKKQPLALFFKLNTITQHSFLPLLYGQDILVRKETIKCGGVDCLDGCDECVLQILRNTMSPTFTRARLLINSYLTHHGYGFLCALPYIFVQNSNKTINKIFTESLETLTKLNSLKRIYKFIRWVWRDLAQKKPFNLIKLPTDITEEDVGGVEEELASKRDPLYRMLTAMLRFYAVEYNSTCAIQLIAGTSVFYDFPREGCPANITAKSFDSTFPAHTTSLKIATDEEYAAFQKRVERMVCDGRHRSRAVNNTKDDSMTAKKRKRMSTHNADCGNHSSNGHAKKPRRRDTVDSDISADNEVLYNKKSGMVTNDDDYESMDGGVITQVRCDRLTARRPPIGTKTIRMSDSHIVSANGSNEEDYEEDV